ncbi:MAG TPA: CapA family protein [Gaiellaceae bacterium]|nr:CapA family protein [Gaiellaceae bacterium]
MDGVGRRRAAAAAGLVLATAGAVAALSPALAPARAPQRAGAPPLRLDAQLPRWLAPGARVNVSGWSAAGARVQLRSRGAVLASTRAGRLGRFELHVRAPARRGRYQLALAAGDRRAQLPPLVVRPVVLAAGGDVNLGAGVGEAIAAGGPDVPWTAVAPVLRAADLALVNLECAVSDRGTPVLGKQYVFRGAPRALAGLARAGIDIVSVANNHSLDYGTDAFLDTLAHARRAGLRPVGGGAELSAARRPVIVLRGGLRIAVLAYSDVRPLGFDAAEGKPGAARADTAWIAEDVARARRRADTVVAYFHWGTELATTPDARQRSFAEAALGAGASVVLGAHPHVLQPLERRGRRLVAWSLGNFVFDAFSPGTTASGILLVGLGADGVRSAELLPARIEGFRPRPDPVHAARVLRRLAA